MNAADSEVYRAFAGRVREQLATARKGAPTVNDTTTPTTETVEAPAVPATFLPTPDGAPCETYPWCAETGAHVDHFSRRVFLPAKDGLPPILMAYLYSDEPAGVPSLCFDPGHDDWREDLTGDELRAEVARVRAHLVRLDAFADEYDAITDDSTAGVLHRAAAYVAEQNVTPEQAEALGVVARAVIEDGDEGGAGSALADALAARPFTFETVELTKDHPLVVRATRHRVHVGWDPNHIGYEQAAMLFHLVAQSAGVDTTGVTLPPPDRVTAAEVAVDEAVAGALAGLRTNPHEVADRLHRAIDRAYAEHLVDILPSVYTEDSAYSNERFCTAERAMADAVKYSRDPALTVTGLRAALDLNLIRDAVPADAHAGYSPAANDEDAETIKTVGASGAILKAYLHTPREIDGAQTGPRVLAVYSEDGTDDELDLDGAVNLREQIAALLPNLDAMIAVLAADEAERQDGGAQR